MQDTELKNYLEKVIENYPNDWLKLTTHRLDIYKEEKAKTEFIEEFEKLNLEGIYDIDSLSQLPTAYDYIRLGHPLSSVLEWAIAKENGLPSKNIICFSSETTPLLAVLRKNLLDKKPTLICYKGRLPKGFDAESIKDIYGYQFELKEIATASDIPDFQGTTLLIESESSIAKVSEDPKVGFYLNLQEGLGSVISISQENDDYISAIQHVRRRETIAMTPANCLQALKLMVEKAESVETLKHTAENRSTVLNTIKEVTGTTKDALIGSSGLSIQYAIMMGLVDHAFQNHPNKAIKFIVPTNCYGGTNDQARRVAAAIDLVDVIDLEVDGDKDMVEGINRILDQLAKEDAVPYIIAEIPTNPRVEVPDLEALKKALEGRRRRRPEPVEGTKDGGTATAPVFILDQTFCPNVQFTSKNGILSTVPTISYVSGSKFPSGGKCTAGYCVANEKAETLMSKIEKHLKLCDNEATDLQMHYLAEQMPSMLDRIQGAYNNTREFVNFIKETLPSAKINFVSEELANEGFTPSVFSLDLPTKGNTHEERENYKRSLNLKLINRMITQIPNESKYCVSYGQLKGCYWTIPATSTQGTTKESDKDYIARVSVSANLDLEKHKEVFRAFVEEEIN